MQKKKKPCREKLKMTSTAPDTKYKVELCRNIFCHWDLCDECGVSSAQMNVPDSVRFVETAGLKCILEQRDKIKA